MLPLLFKLPMLPTARDVKLLHPVRVTPPDEIIAGQELLVSFDKSEKLNEPLVRAGKVIERRLVPEFTTNPPPESRSFGALKFVRDQQL